MTERKDEIIKKLLNSENNINKFIEECKNFENNYINNEKDFEKIILNYFLPL